MKNAIICKGDVKMLNPFTYSDTNKRYYTYDYYLKTKYNSKVSKIALDGGFYCPNRDGKVSFGGCIFCSALGFLQSLKISSKLYLIKFGLSK